MKRSTMIAIAVVVVVLLVIIGLVIFLNRENTPPPASTSQVGVTPGATPGTVPNVAKPKPVDQTFDGCPASGDGGDPALNTLKNRIDENNWVPVTVNSILDLQWPHTIERTSRARWTAFDTAEIARYEGTPVQTVGYLVDAKKQGPESCNCHAVSDLDFHIWMVGQEGQTRDQAVVVEASPRVRSYHPAWTISTLQQIIKNKTEVRISGWLMMDPEHPDQIGKTRGTIWEIHPIMQIETMTGGAWKPLDNGTTGVKSAPVAVTASGQAATAVSTEAAISPVVTASPPPPGSSRGQYNNAVQITTVDYDGRKSREPDEYVEITNKGTQPVDITDWVLEDQADRNEYTWESYTMPPKQVIRVYTNEVHKSTGGFTFGWGNPIWPNTGGVAELLDNEQQLVSKFAYGKQK